jgi:hypothetical protein
MFALVTLLVLSAPAEPPTAVLVEGEGPFERRAQQEVISALRSWRQDADARSLQDYFKVRPAGCAAQVACICAAPQLDGVRYVVRLAAPTIEGKRRAADLRVFDCRAGLAVARSSQVLDEAQWPAWSGRRIAELWSSADLQRGHFPAERILLEPAQAPPSEPAAKQEPPKPRSSTPSPGASVTSPPDEPSRGPRPLRLLPAAEQSGPPTELPATEVDRRLERVASGLFLGATGGALGGITLGLVGCLPGLVVAGESGCVFGAGVGAWTGAALGSALGVWLAWHLLEHRLEPDHTVLGGFVGATLTAIVWLAVLASNAPGQGLLLVAAVPLPAIGAVLGAEFAASLTSPSGPGLRVMPLLAPTPAARGLVAGISGSL